MILSLKIRLQNRTEMQNWILVIMITRYNSVKPC